MSSPYGREVSTKQMLDALDDVTAFIPMERYERMVGHANRQRVISERPVIRNLLFVQATEERMRQLKLDYNTLLQFKTHPTEQGNRPIIVPNKQMDDFIRLYEHPEVQLQFFTPSEIAQLNLRPEAKVKIEDGIFAGLEGYYQRVKGGRKKRFVVRVDDVLACAAALAECRYISV